MDGLGVIFALSGGNALSCEFRKCNFFHFGFAVLFEIMIAKILLSNKLNFTDTPVSTSEKTMECH